MDGTAPGLRDEHPDAADAVAPADPAGNDTAAGPDPEAEPNARPRAWPGVVLSAGICAGAALMLYGAAQNAKTGPGPAASAAGVVVVIASVVGVVVLAMRTSARERVERRLGVRRFELRCTTCDAVLPGAYGARVDADALAKVVKVHEARAHPPFDPAILKVLAVRMALVDAGTVALPAMIRRYEVTAAGA